MSTVLIGCFQFIHLIIVRWGGQRLQYRVVEEEKSTPKTNIIQLQEYKMNLVTKLITDNEAESDDRGETEYDELEPKHKKKFS